jgi:enoyl-CoA hydratase/carnithine racemase
MQGMGSTHFLPMVAGPEVANYLLVSGRVSTRHSRYSQKDPRLTVYSVCLKLFTGVEAKEFGLVHKAVPAVRP